MAIGNGDSEKPPLELLEYDPLNPIMVNECNGAKEDSNHSLNCDGLCSRRPLEFLEIEIINEERLWYHNDMDPNSVTVNTVTMNMQLQSLRQLIMDLGIISKEDMDEGYMRFKLENMRRLREVHAPKVKKNRMKRMIATPPRPGLLGPDGKPIRRPPQ